MKIDDGVDRFEEVFTVGSSNDGGKLRQVVVFQLVGLTNRLGGLFRCAIPDRPAEFTIFSKVISG